MSSPSDRIRFLCTECGNRLRAKLGTEGRSVRCPFCKSIQVVPGNTGAAARGTLEKPVGAPKAASEELKALAAKKEMVSQARAAVQDVVRAEAQSSGHAQIAFRVRFICKQCGNRLRAKPGMEGQVFKCPFCASIQVVPIDAEATVRATQEILTQSQEAFQTNWQPQMLQEEKKTLLERYFHLIQRCMSQLQTEAQRILDDENMPWEQKERLMLQQASETYQAARVFRQTLTAWYRKRRREIQSYGEESQRLKAELETMNRQEREIDLLIRVMFESEVQSSIDITEKPPTQAPAGVAAPAEIPPPAESVAVAPKPEGTMADVPPQDLEETDVDDSIIEDQPPGNSDKNPPDNRPT